MYHDVNMLMGDVVKVTPSSKVVGDLALYLINLNMKVGRRIFTHLPILMNFDEFIAKFQWIAKCTILSSKI